MNLLKINLGINDLKKEREHVKNLIIKTDERIDKLMRELRKTEPKTQESTLESAHLIQSSTITEAKPYIYYRF